MRQSSKLCLVSVLITNITETVLTLIATLELGSILDDECSAPLHKNVSALEPFDKIAFLRRHYLNQGPTMMSVRE